VARSPAAGFDRSALVAGDDFFAFITRSFITPWLPEAHAQNEVVIRLAAAAAGRLATGGYIPVDTGLFKGAGLAITWLGRNLGAAAEVGAPDTAASASLGRTNTTSPEYRTPTCEYLPRGGPVLESTASRGISRGCWLLGASHAYPVVYFQIGGHNDSMAQIHDDLPRSELSATTDGRVTIPAQVRRAAGIEPGQTLVVYVERGRVVIEERAHLLARIQDEVISAATAAGHTGSVVDELIADRRAEAAREETRT